MTRSVITVMLFLAYELGYWFNHWLSHKVPLLWEFHKVHHTAEVLTPLTNFRVHPVYTWIFANILAFSAAIANGFGNYMFGETAYQYALSDTNIILVLFIHAYVHLQHSHMWIAFRGVLGRIFVSRPRIIRCITRPIRSTSTRTSAVAWRCGTGCSARSTCRQKEREPLTFGFADQPDAHTVKGELVDPLHQCRGPHLRPKRPDGQCRLCRLRSASRPS